MRNVLITGASSGIGAATAQQLIELGAEVTGIARDFSKCVQSEMQTITLDLSDIDALPDQLRQQPLLKKDFDTLILNAGMGRFGGIEQFSYAQLKEVVDLNLLSQLFLIKHFLPSLKKLPKANIVLIGSEAALQGAKQGSVYCATKFAVRGLAQSLAADCASSNVRVSLINPGPVRTPFFDELHFEPEQGEEYALSPEIVAKTIIEVLQKPNSISVDEVNIQPNKRAFIKK